MQITIKLGGRHVAFNVTHYLPELPAITTGSSDNWEDGSHAELEWEYIGSEEGRDLLDAVLDEFDLHDRLEGLLLDKIEKGEDL